MNEKVPTPVSFCPRYHHAVELIGRRWTGAILREIYAGTHRFSDIAAAVPGLSDRLLSERLKELETEGIVTRTVYPDTPVRIEYCLTDKGRDLGRVMDEIATWASRWLDELPAEPCEQLTREEAVAASGAAAPR